MMYCSTIFLFGQSLGEAMTQRFQVNASGSEDRLEHLIMAPSESAAFCLYGGPILKLQKQPPLKGYA
jgi:hypothetical protein